MSGPIIVLQINELSARVLHTFIDEGELPHLRKMQQESATFETEADPTGVLNPWVQWVSFNHGIPADQHGAQFLGDAAEASGTPFWEQRDRRRSVVLFPMNGRPADGVDIFAPDFWCEDSSLASKQIRPFFQFARQATLGSASGSKWSLIGKGLSQIPFLIRCSVGASFFARAGLHLLGEKYRDQSWKRAPLFEELAWRVFVAMCSSVDAKLGVYFSNTIAFLQHRYWHWLEPEHFEQDLTTSSDPQPAVLTGYRLLDREIRELDRKWPDATIILVSALGQVPHVNAKRTYLPREIDRLFADLRIDPPLHIAKLMSEQYRLEFESEADLSRCLDQLRMCSVGGQPLFDLLPSDCSMIFKCGVHVRVDSSATVDNGRGVTLPFGSLMKPLSVKTGEHDPSGVLWVRDPRRQGYAFDHSIPLVGAGQVVAEFCADGNSDRFGLAERLSEVEQVSV